MLDRIKKYTSIEVLIAVASGIFGLLIGPVLEKITSPLFDTTTRALLTGFFFLTILTLISIILTGIFSRRREKDIANVSDELAAINRVASLGTTVRSLGISGITADWTDLINFKGDLGERFKAKLQAVEAPATWYLITMSPEAFMSWLPYQLKPAIEQRGINLKWVYHSPKSLITENALKVQWEWLNNRYPDWKDRSGEKGLHHLNSLKQELERWARESSLEIEAKEEVLRQHAGTWEFYESRVPHFYMAFISVPWEQQPLSKERPSQAPNGTFGFVHMYPMFPHSYHSRSALFLETPGDILNYYYWSSVEMFDEGVRRGYVWKTWPGNTHTISEGNSTH